MPGEEDEAVQATVDDIMDKTSGAESGEQPIQETNSTTIKQPQMMLTQKVQQKQQVDAVRQLNKNGLDSSLPAFKPSSVGSGGRRSTSADSERSLRLEIAESSGGGTSGAESSPLATPLVEDNGGATPTMSDCKASNAIGATDSQQNVDDKTPVANITANIEKKANVGELPILKDDVIHKQDPNPTADICLNSSADDSNDPMEDAGIISCSSSSLVSSALPTTQTKGTDADVVTQSIAVPLVTSGVITTSSLSLTTPSAIAAQLAIPTATLASSCSGANSTIVTVSIAGKSAASITAAAAAAAVARSGANAGNSTTGAAPAPPTLALMRAPIQPTPVTRILPRPPTKKTQQSIVVTATSANSSTSSSTTATTSTIAPVCGTTMAIATKQGGSKSVASGGAAFVRAQQLTSGSATVFNGAKTTTIATVQKSGAGVFANGTVSSATTKFAAVAPQRVGATGGVSCVAPLTPLDGVVSAKELPMDLYNLAGSSSSCNNSYTITTSTTEMSASSMDKFNDTVNRVAAGTEISPPHPSTQLQQQMLVVTQTSATSMASSAALTPTITTASSTLTTATTAKGLVTASAGQLQHGGAEKGPQLQVLKPKPPKKKKAPAALKMKNVTTNGTDGSVDDTEQRNTTISIVDMQQQQQSSSTAPLFPVCSAVSATAPPGSGMLFPPNFALTATPNGTVGASLMTAYPNGGPGGGITQYFIRQTTSSGHQLIPVISSQQQFFFSPMPPASAEAVDSNNVTPNAQSATTLSFQGQTTEDQQQRMVIQQHQQQQVRNLYFRSGNEILMPAMVSNNVAGGANVNLSPPVAPSSQHSVVHPSFVASIQHRPSPAQPQQKGTFVGIQPKGMATAVAARTPIAPKGGNQPTGEASTAGSSSNHQSVSTPVVMIGGHPSYQQLSTAPSQQQYFLTSSGAIVTLQAPPHHFQQPQQHLSTLSNVRVLPSANSNPSAFAITSADTEQYMQKNGMVGSTPNSSRSAAANSLTAKVSSPKRKRKMDTKNAVVNTTVTTTTIPVDIDPTKYLSHHQMTEDPSTVDEEENEPPPVLCRVFNRSDDEPVVSTQSMESLFQREAKIIRERMFDGNGKKFGPLKHFIDGFEIEEDIEPFPCEHQQLLDKLKRDQAGLEAEIGGDMQKETDATKSGTVSPEKTAEIAVENAVRRKGHKRTASVLSPGSSPTSSPKKSNTMETDTYERMEVNNSHSTEEDSCAVAIDASGTSEEKANHQQRQLSADEHAAAAADDSATDLASVVKKGRRRELDGLLKMDFGKHSPFQTSDPDKYAKEVLIEARQQQRTLALAQEEQRNARRSVESSAGGSTTGKSSKRDKHAKKPFSPPVSPLPESRSASVHSTTPTVTSKGKNQGEKAYSSSSVSSKLAKASGGGQTTKEGNNNSAALVMENKLKISPKDSFSLEQRRSCGSNVSEEGEERCLYCRRSFKEVSRDKDHVQYCSKSCRKQLKAAKRMKHSGGSLDEGMNSSIGMAGDEPRNGVATATPLHRRSDPSSSSDSSGQQQQSACHITSPLGSAFSAMQPQMLSKRRLPVDQHAEQLMSLNQRLSGNNGSGLAPPFVPPPYGQSPTTDQTQAMLAVPMAIRPTSGGPQTMIQYGTPTAMYFNAATHHQMVVSSSNSTADQQQQAAAAVHAYQQQQQQQHHHEQHMLYATPGTVAGGPQQQQQHFFPPAGPSGVHPGTPTQFLPPPMARQQSFSTAPSSSPATPVPTPTSFMERNVEIDALVTRGVHTWTKEEVCKWVNFVTGSDTNGDRFVDEDVDGTSLLCLNQEQLKTELKFKLGPAIKLWSALEVLKRNMMC